MARAVCGRLVSASEDEIETRVHLHVRGGFVSRNKRNFDRWSSHSPHVAPAICRVGTCRSITLIIRNDVGLAYPTAT